MKKKKKIEEPEEEEEDLDEEEDEEEDEDDEEEEEDEVTSEPKEEISKEELQRLHQIDQEITRLRDHGVFNAEALFQLIKINENLDRIATVLERIGGSDGKKHK